MRLALLALAIALTACPGRRTFDRSELEDGGDASAFGEGGLPGDLDGGVLADGGDAGPDAPPFTGPYPSGPYGTKKGDTIADLSFIGYAKSSATQTSVLALHDVFDPQGTRTRLLVLIVTGAWCGLPCTQLPFDAVRWSADAGRSDIAIAAVLVKSTDTAVPAKDQDAKNLSTQIAAPYFVGRDPPAALGAYVDLDVMPAAIFVDTRTMKIARVIVGVPQDLGAEIRAALQ